jgi:hypothetical protein
LLFLGFFYWSFFLAVSQQSISLFPRHLEPLGRCLGCNLQRGTLVSTVLFS